MATFLANEINAKDRDVTGPTEQVKIMFLLNRDVDNSRKPGKLPSCECSWLGKEIPDCC